MSPISKHFNPLSQTHNFINSVYFDNNNIACYHRRIKAEEGAQLLRIRWYGGACGQVRTTLFFIILAKYSVFTILSTMCSPSLALRSHHSHHPKFSVLTILGAPFRSHPSKVLSFSSLQGTPCSSILGTPCLSIQGTPCSSLQSTPFLSLLKYFVFIPSKALQSHPAIGRHSTSAGG
jgi:VTC domain